MGSSDYHQVEEHAAAIECIQKVSCFVRGRLGCLRVNSTKPARGRELHHPCSSCHWSKITHHPLPFPSSLQNSPQAHFTSPTLAAPFPLCLTKFLFYGQQKLTFSPRTSLTWPAATSHPTSLLPNSLFPIKPILLLKVGEFLKARI